MHSFFITLIVMALLLKTLVSFLTGVGIIMALLFIPAGTLSYSRAWLFMALLFIPILVVGIVHHGTLRSDAGSSYQERRTGAHRGPCWLCRL